MDAAQIRSVLDTCEAVLARGEQPDLGALGFWKAVGAAKRDPALRDEFAGRIADVDRRAFEAGVVFHLGLGLGTRLMVLLTAVGLGIVAAGYYVPDPWDGLSLLAGTGVLLVTTHGLAHLAVGAKYGIRFTHWFVGSLLRPQPGVKIDYATYLRTPARERARMHASGAVVTKLVPFAMLGAAWGMEAPGWAWLVLIAVGVGSSITDALWSRTSSDWKRFARERRLADRGL